MAFYYIKQVMKMSNKINLPETGFLRLNQILELIPVGKSTWWARVKRGEYPQPIKLGKKTTAWRAEDIKELIESLSNSDCK